MVLATLLFLIPGFQKVESCQGKALKAKRQLTFFVSFHVGHRWPCFLNPSPISAEDHKFSVYFSTAPQMQMLSESHFLFHHFRWKILYILIVLQILYSEQTTHQIQI